ncbi:MAG: TIGR04149 family rSAM-modified RiPP [Marinifilaceae bacterium]
MKKLKLNHLSKDELKNKEMSLTQGGSHCGCGCHYKEKGGSGTYTNGNYNYAGGQHSKGGDVICSSGGYWYAAD